jgi:outer membrane receptor for Fe3+-dicitrate
LTGGLFVQYHALRHEGTLEQGALCTATGSADPCSATEPLEAAKTLYDYTHRKETLSAFVRETLRPTQRLAVHLELQATRHGFSMGDDRIRGLSWETHYSFVAPRIGVNWNASDKLGFYGTVSTADSEPTFVGVWSAEDPWSPPGDAFRGYDETRRLYSDPLARPEKLRDYEAGATYRSGATLLKAALYRMEFQDEFVPQGGLNQDGLPVTVNAGRSLHRGVELEAGGRLPGGIDASAYLALSDDVLQDFTLYGTGPSGESVSADYSGNAIAGFPDHTARVRLARQFGPARVLLGARQIGTIFLDNSEDERKNPSARLAEGYVAKRIDPYTVVDAQLSLDLTRLVKRRGATLRLDLWVDNLLDRRYSAMGYSYPNEDFTSFYTEFFPAATRNFLAGLTYGF